jgi:predicted MFS family arabinose efflux permease
VKTVSLAPDSWIPILYSIAMAVDALAALGLGRLFDRRGLPILIGAPLLSCLFAPLAFSTTFGLVLAGTVLWGVGMGAQESVVRAAIAVLIPAERRGTAYGVFNSVYGLAWFAGSAAMGFLYDVSIPLLIAFSVLMHGLAVAVVYAARRDLRSASLDDAAGDAGLARQAVDAREPGAGPPDP